MTVPHVLLLACCCKVPWICSLDFTVSAGSAQHRNKQASDVSQQRPSGCVCTFALCWCVCSNSSQSILTRVAQSSTTDTSWCVRAVCLHVNTLAINPEAAPATMPCQIAVSPPFLTISCNYQLLGPPNRGPSCAACTVERGARAGGESDCDRPGFSKTIQRQRSCYSIICKFMINFYDLKGTSSTTSVPRTSKL